MWLDWAFSRDAYPINAISQFFQRNVSCTHNRKKEVAYVEKKEGKIL
jgi:hypothetical protein